jgi:hypothetical protein
MSINTNNFNLEYSNKIYEYEKQTTNYIITEIYRSNLFYRLQNKILKYREKYLSNIVKINPLIDINDKINYMSIGFTTDLLTILICNHKFNSNFDTIFDNISPFNKQSLYNYFEVEKCIFIIDNIKKMIYNIFPKLEKKYIKYYKKLKHRIKFFDNIKYDIQYEKITDKTYIIKLKISDSNLHYINNLKYNNELIISNHIFIHLIKLYNIKNLNNFTSDEILDNNIIGFIYILFNRYNIFSSGNNQGSVLPSFKKFLKTYFNIKIELFGSPLNTSNTNYGSFFYDIDKYFGSLGNFFDINIKKGYYEINPPFDKCLIDKIFDKLLKDLINAENNKEALLFCLIIPKSYFINRNYDKLTKKFNYFFKHSILFNKDKFPYIRYNKTFTKTLVSPIVDTYIIILHNSNICPFVQTNIKKFRELVNNWTKKII